MDKKEPIVHFKVGLVLRREFRWDNITYKAFYILKQKNSNNMWYIERLWSKPEVPIKLQDQFDKQFMSKEIILRFLEMLGNDIKIETLKVLFG